VISFQPTDEEKEFSNVAAKVASDKIRPAAHDCEQNREVATDIKDELANLGFLSLELPESNGGLELPLITQAQIMTSLSYGDLGTVQGLPGANDAASFARSKENAQLQAKLDGEQTTAFIDVTDADLSLGEALQINKQSSGYSINGLSQPVRHATSAASIIIAGKDADGEAVVLLLDNQNNWDVTDADIRLGLLAAGIGRFSFGQTEVEGDNILASGEEAENWIRAARSRIYILQAAKEVGLMHAALDYATGYTAERRAFGQSIAGFQGVSFRIAQMAIETRIANHLVWEAAVKADAEETDAWQYALQAINRAHQAVRYVTDSAVQLLGGHGFVQEYPAEKWARDALAQVTLYGRETDFLSQRGEEILQSEKKGVTT